MTYSRSPSPGVIPTGTLSELQLPSAPDHVVAVESYVQAQRRLELPEINGALLPGTTYANPLVPPVVREFWQTCNISKGKVSVPLSALNSEIDRLLQELGFPSSDTKEGILFSPNEAREIWKAEICAMAAWACSFAGSNEAEFLMTTGYPANEWHLDTRLALTFQAFDGEGPLFTSHKYIATWQIDELRGYEPSILLEEGAPIYRTPTGTILLTRDFKGKVGPINTLNMLPHMSPSYEGLEQPAPHRLLVVAGAYMSENMAKRWQTGLD